METNRDIPQIIYPALDIMRNCFDGTEVKLLSEKMYRLSPDEYAKAGRLGVDIEVLMPVIKEIERKRALAK